MEKVQWNSIDKTQNGLKYSKNYKSSTLPRVTYYILFHQCNNKNIIYQQFYCCLRYIFYTQLILLCFDAYFPGGKWHFGCKKCIFSHSFWPRWLKQTSFYREFNYLDSHRFSFFRLPSVSSKNNTKQNKYCIKM